MSFKIIGKAFDIPLRGNDKLVFLALCEYADDENNQCYPSIATIMKKATVSKSVATRCLNVLEYLGYIVRDKRKRDNGSNTSTLYTVNVDIALDKEKYKEATQKFRSVNRDNQSSESGQGASNEIGTTKVQNRDNQSSESGQLEPLVESLDKPFNKKNTKKKIPITPKEIIDFFKENISDKNFKLQEQSSYTQLALHKDELDLILIGLRNYAKALPEDKIFIKALPNFIKNKIYLDYKEEIIKVSASKAVVPIDLIGKKYCIDGEDIEFQKDGYLKIEKDWKITKPENVEDMIKLVRNAS